MEAFVARARQSKSSLQTSQKSLPPSLSSKIFSALSTIDRPAAFSASGQFPAILPGLNVDGLGDIALPLSATEAKRLIKYCQQAPYGKGTETVVDTKVRKVWELGPNRFSFENPKWDSALESVLREIEDKLGLAKKALAAHLYKLLVYEKGSFFLPHRDGEKVDRMVATLVVNLPAKYAGGELVILHQGKQQTIAMSRAASGLETEYAAFYADCQHEVRPLQSGYRLCLTYNLVLAKPRSRICVTPPDFEEVTQTLEAILSNWPSTKSENQNPKEEDLKSPSKLAVMLEHQYTEGSLSIDNLKGVDLAQANILFDAAERAQCDAHLALVTLWQNGSAEGGDDSYGHGRRSYSRWDEEDDEEEEEEEDSESGSEYSMGEIYDYSLTANHWSDRKGKKISFGEIPIKDDEIVSAVKISDTDPSREEFEGYTGNAGMTLERWYHRAAIIMWPRQNQFQIWCNAGTDAAIAVLQKLLTQLNKTKKDRDSRLDECRRFAKQIIETWDPLRRSSQWDSLTRKAAEQPTRNRDSFWKMLAELDSPELISNAWQQVVPNDSSLTFPPTFLRWLDKEGWGAYLQPILFMANRTSKENLGRNIAFFRQLSTLPKISSERRKLCNDLALIFLVAIERIDSEDHGSWNAPRIDRKELTVDVAKSLAAIDNEKLMSRFFDWQFDHERYNIIEVQIPSAIQLASKSKEIVTSSPAVQGWIQRISKELQMRTKTEPKKPKDWQRSSELSCNCSDCKQLSAFLANPTQAEARFPLAKQRRQHLHGVIEGGHCDCTHQTLRVGSPQVLVCKKTNGSYDRACQVYKQDLQHLATIQKIVGLWK